MRLLLTSNAPHSPPKGGSTRSNLIWLGHMARRGDTCEVVCPTIDSTSPDTETVDASGIRIHSVRDLSRRPSVLPDRIKALTPDWVLVSSEDVAHVLLREAYPAAPTRIVYLAHTPQFFPFGPASWNPDPQAADLVRSSAGIVAIGEHMAGYIKSHLGRDPAVIHPPIYGDPPYPRFGNFDEGWILMINPSAVKGIRIFLALADRFPDYTFAALTGWATTTDDRVELAHRPNVVVLETVPRIDDVLAKSRLLLMPSLWYEGFGLIAMEAMLRGVPVISSDSGGLMEAKQGTGFVVPVRPIQRYEPHFDETHMPRPLEPAQDIEPWVQALQKLLTQKDAYMLEADRSRQVATEFVSKLKASEFEAYLALLQPSPDSGSAALPGTNSDARLSGLSPAKRALLLQKLRERAKG